MKTKMIVSSIIIVIVVILINVVPECTGSEKPVHRSESELRSFLTDSITTANKEAENVRLDSIKTAIAARTIKAEQDVRYWHYEAVKRQQVADKYKNIADELTSAYDSAGPCWTYIDQCRTAYRQAYDSLYYKQQALIEENKALNTEAEGYSQQLFIEQKQSLNKDTVIMSKVERIQSLEADNERLQCYGNHRFKSWFWKWISGQEKCK